MRFINRKTLAIAGAAVALVAVGSTGTAVAGSLIGSSDIEDGSIRSIDVKDGSLKRADLSNPINRSLARITKDGVQGPKGAQGAPGVDGKNAFATSYVNSGPFTVPAGGHSDHTTSCNTGDLAIGGGFSFSLNEQGFSRVLQNRMDWSQAAQDEAVAHGQSADARPDGWYVEATGGDAPAKGYVWVTCVSTH
jgi:hypothetical protein